MRISRQKTDLYEIIPFDEFYISSFIENEEYEEGDKEGYEKRYKKEYKEGYEKRYKEGYKKWHEKWYKERCEEEYGINQSEVDKKAEKDKTTDKDSIMEQELKNIEPLYPIAVNMVCSCWKKLDN
ncbi:hypothetical protein F8M41_008248 [Gigaspora margarita]|uniref:Uncharacterized protein n=1 Tax=Gigaspora margarita TaxID=4874 RepID=A0A8H4AVQ6_GIGMA|nr:hypothetical protein F8M41_008248 [Gigaspora margarita]